MKSVFPLEFFSGAVVTTEKPLKRPVAWNGTSARSDWVRGRSRLSVIYICVQIFIHPDYIFNITRRGCLNKVYIG